MTDRIARALHHIDPNDRDVWLTMGMAIKSELGDSGYDTWLDWSKDGSTFNAKDAQSVWKSIRPHGAVSIASLFHKASEGGWRDEGIAPTPQQLAERKRKAEIRAKAEQEEIDKERIETASKAKQILALAALVDCHPYLERKGVKATTTLRQIDASQATSILGYQPKASAEPLQGCLLVVPVKQDSGVSTLELIDEQGRKTALAGRGTKSGGYWATQKLTDAPVVIGEGVATVLSVSQATGMQGVAALSASNLPNVAETLSKRCAELIILADIGRGGKPHPKALEAAEFGKLAVPTLTNGGSDFNDMALAQGLEAVRSSVLNARSQHVEDRVNKHLRDVCLVRASDVTPEAIEWLWDGWLATGKMHVFGGAPGTGKTTISMWLAATVTTGGRWPDGSRSISGNVVIWSGEDDPRDTLVPRLISSGADLSRVYFIDDVRDVGVSRSFDPARDIEPLTRKLTEIGDVKLLIVDPIVSAIMGDSHKNAEVRRGLQPLVDLASSMRCALLGITHFSKGTGGRDPVERLTGSLAFGALARVVLVAAKHQSEGNDGRAVRLFCRAKSNIGPDDGGFEYDLHQAELSTKPGIFASSVLWGDAVDGVARELLATADAYDGEGGTITDAKRFLLDLLADSPLPAKVVKGDASDAGYSWATIRRAQKALGIESVKEGGRFGASNQRWVWRLPPEHAQGEHLQRQSLKMLKNTEDVQQNKVSTFRKSEHLQANSDDVEVEI